MQISYALLHKFRNMFSTSEETLFSTVVENGSKNQGISLLWIPVTLERSLELSVVWYLQIPQSSK